MRFAGVLLLIGLMAVVGWSQAAPQSSPANTNNSVQGSPAGTNGNGANAQASSSTSEPTSVSALGGNPQADPVVPDKAGQDYADRQVQPVGTSALPSAPAPTPENARQDFQSNVKDVHFDLNKSELRPEDQAILQQDAEWLKAHPDVKFTIEGDADERGNIAYNLFLSDQRALAVRDALVKLGVPEQQILYANGWGKLYPQCVQSDESCWAQNRRSHLAAWPPEDLGQRAANQLPSTGAETSSGGGR